MKRLLLLISLLWLVGCAGPRPQTITVTLTPPPTLAHPHAWLTKEYPETHCTAYLNVDTDAQPVTWLRYTWEVPSGGSLIACPGRLRVCETVNLETCRDVAPPSPASLNRPRPWGIDTADQACSTDNSWGGPRTATMAKTSLPPLV